MSLTVSTGSKQGVVRLINKCIDRFNTTRNDHGKIEVNDAIITRIAQSGQSQADKILRIASQYALHRIRREIETSKNVDDIPTECWTNSSNNSDRDEIKIKIESADIIDAISYLGLPLAPYFTRKYTRTTARASLSPIFLEDTK